MCWYKYFAGQEAIWLIQALSSPFGLPMISIFIHYFFLYFACTLSVYIEWSISGQGQFQILKEDTIAKLPWPTKYTESPGLEKWPGELSLILRSTYWMERIKSSKLSSDLHTFSVAWIFPTKEYILTLFSVIFLIFAISETNTVMLFFSSYWFLQKNQGKWIFCFFHFLHNNPLEIFFLEFAWPCTHLSNRKRQALLGTWKVTTGAMEKANNLSNANSSAFDLTSL